MATIYNFNTIPPSQYVSLVKSQTVRPRFRLSLLYPDETIRADISQYLVYGSGNLTVNYQQGSRRSLNFKLNNTDGMFTPSSVGLIWMNTKFKLELGLEMDNGDVVYDSAGIFVIGNPNAARSGAEKTIDIQCYDKFALLDGTLGGTLEATYLVNQGTNILHAMQDTLLQDNGNGYPIDIKPIIFDTTYINAKCEYDLSKSPNDSLGEILISLANMISCDIWYDTNGNLTVRSGIVDVSHVTKPTLWKYSDQEYEYLSANVTYDFTSVKNYVTIVGANANGENIYFGIAKNTNPQSPTRIEKVGTKTYYLEDSNIYSESLAQQRAEYELNKLSILSNAISLESAYMIHLDVNNCIELNDNYFGYNEYRFIIQSISMSLSTDAKITIDCTNIATLPYYTTNSGSSS
jgi:hypothetical protein